MLPPLASYAALLGGNVFVGRSSSATHRLTTSAERPLCASSARDSYGLRASLCAAAASRATAPQRPSGVFGHLGLLLRLLAARLVGRLLPQRRRRPQARLLRSGFRHDLRQAGLGVARVPLDAIEALRPLASQLCASARAADAKGGRGSAWASAALPRFARPASALNGAFPPSMAWYWASDNDALELFLPAAAAIVAQLGRGFELVAASFVVADGGCPFDGSKFHLDFGPPSIPRGETTTALLPLHPAVFPEGEGNLEYRAWDAPADAASAIHRYRAGEAAVFDGKLPHRTQPFDSSAFAQGGVASSAEGEDGLSALRVLVSLSFAARLAEAPWRGAVGDVIRGYGAQLLQPLGGPPLSKTN